MSLKEITQHKHSEAESTKFMKAVFDNRMPPSIWANFTYNKMIFYGTIEVKSRAEGLLDGIEGIVRARLLYEDYKDMQGSSTILDSTHEYCKYINNLEPGKVLAHLYTWHMGDLHGGQMIKRVIDAPHRSLEFEDRMGLINALRSKLDDSLGDEAISAFDWAIKIMKEYDDHF